MIKVLKLLFLSLLFKGVVFATPFLMEDLKKEKINVVAFVTSWCFPCQKTTEYLLSLSEKNSDIFVTLFFVDEEIPKNIIKTGNLNLLTISYEESKKFGVDKSVPYILIFDKNRNFVKKYGSFNESLLSKLINNLKNGLYENGTLPLDERIDLWQKKRF